MVEIYGFRGTDERLAYLSPFEFFMYWAAEPVMPPYHEQCGGRSVWCAGGKEYYETHKHDYPRCKLIAGTHYRVVEGCEDYVVFSDTPVLRIFRHRWVLVKNQRPLVPVFTHSKLPRPGLSAEESARLCSVATAARSLPSAPAAASDAARHVARLA